MKKFLCYDTNDAASGKVNVGVNGVLKPDATVPSSSGEPFKSLVTDGEGGVKWEDRLAYVEDSKVVVVLPNGAKFVKVSDEIPSWASGNEAVKYWASEDDLIFTVTPNQFTFYDNRSFSIGAVLFITTDNLKFNDIVIPKKGVYFATSISTMGNASVTGIASANSDMPEITWNGNIETIKTIDPKYIPSELNEIVLPSSTSGSSKKFKITVDDSGTITATEI